MFILCNSKVPGPVIAPTTKVAILDFDGVLNSVSFLKEARKKKLDLTLPRNILDPARVQLLNDIEQLYRPLWIFSTSWRSDESMEELNDALQRCGFQGEVRYSLPYHGVTRGDEIHHGMELWGLPRTPSRCILLDDDESVGAYPDLVPLWIRTETRFGLNHTHIKEVLQRWR